MHPLIFLALSLIGCNVGIIYICPAYRTARLERSYELRMGKYLVNCKVPHKCKES